MKEIQEIKLNVNQSKGYEGVVLPQVTTNEEGKKLVSGRELHEALEVKTHYKDWIKRMVSYGFIENIDYTTIAQKRATAQGNMTIQNEHILTLDMAKHVAMIQRSEIGMKIRNYFIECEKQLQNQTPQLTEKQQLQLLILNGGELERISALKQYEELVTKPLLDTIEEQKPKVYAYNEFMESDGTYTTTNACKMLGLKRSYVFAVLREKGYVFKNRTEATQKGIDKGYFKQIMKSGYSTMVITPKGIEFLRTLKSDSLTTSAFKKLKGYGNC